MPLRRWAPLAATAAALLAPPAPAEPATGPDALPPALGPIASDPTLRSLWLDGLDLERREQLLDSSARYEQLAEALPGSPFLRWRLSRNHWRIAERLPVEDKPGRLHHFQLAETWANRGLELDPECGECVMWKLAAVGRIATTQGVVKAAGTASTIAELIERGLALEPRHVDGPSNVTLANLYYAGAAFYRVVPEWFWLPWVIGVRGDKERALDYIQRAIALSAPRVDYQVELGAILLCLGRERDDPARLAQGRRVLQEALDLDDFQSTDSVDREHAEIMMREPELACGYSRDGWIDLAGAEEAHGPGNGRNGRLGPR